MSTYNGPERRKLLEVRAAINDASYVQKMVLKRMARMLGPDRLKDLNAELGEKKREMSSFHSVKTLRMVAAESGFMSAYNGPERRKLLEVRAAINDASDIQQMAMRSMARMLGPDRLKDLNAELGEKRREMTSFRSIKTPRMVAAESEFFKLAANKLPSRIKEMSMEHFSLSDGTLQALNEAGIKSVADFIMKRESELMAVYGLKEEVIRETRDYLFSNWGIRTIENPPEPE
jgi:uncharacterized protein (DUF2267 family)